MCKRDKGINPPGVMRLIPLIPLIPLVWRGRQNVIVGKARGARVSRVSRISLKGCGPLVAIPDKPCGTVSYSR